MADQHPLPEVIPYNAQWDITSGCNHRCTFCLSSSGDPSPGELNTVEAIDLIDQLYDEGIWFLKIMGGEPFFRKDILTILKHAASKGMVLSFSTNASMISEEKATGLSEINNSILYAQMSLYGECPETYQRVTGSAAHYDRALKGLARMVEAGLDVSVLTVVTQENVARLLKYFDIAREYGAKEFRLAPEVALGRSANRAEALTKAARGLWPTFLEQVAEIRAAATPEDPLILLDARPTLARYLSKFTGCSTFYENCTAATTMIYIGPTGLALPCPFLGHLPEQLRQHYSHLRPGDIRKNSFPDIWNSETFVTFRSYYDPAFNLFDINTECRHFKSGKCIPCAVTPCNCADMIRVIKNELDQDVSSRVEDSNGVDGRAGTNVE
jgi:MoaA/NifB/PqqE/SkfB family radical SAM enzyme